ncbi:hypothetical protein Pmar_PMAR024957 [Perkinsus marinus ATCC 50983]|uniref:Uncharacterized protein n=1 Tax=Perkinsus marinus (strain ATCC 50983 / TXsc) TaxID=423536 RepID=C5L9Q0_PERM5|nr:hypothetical protein Pmar_PMAR024957 [Perkinsus marinus ATCC 50983]EER06540.1 hypothetical protein Pmar_PMAR024957 [Perkinsus marinus ATCC 50983]|eukprot:XP_002774724.1 hypothetical protein Pmar_PMAR024957 [Perkinsus marinus ATCC 50983]
MVGGKHSVHSEPVSTLKGTLVNRDKRQRTRRTQDTIGCRRGCILVRCGSTLQTKYMEKVLTELYTPDGSPDV